MTATSPMLSMGEVQEVPKDVLGWMAFMGLGDPKVRAAAVALVATAACYHYKWPAQFFEKDGTLRKFGVEPEAGDEDAPKEPQPPFILVPIAAAAAAYYFL